MTTTGTHINDDFEARLQLDVSADGKQIVGSLDRKSIKPIKMAFPVRANETNTNLKYDEGRRALVFENERAKNSKGSPDYVTVTQLLAGADISEIGGVQDLINKGLLSVVVVNGELQIKSTVPALIESGEQASGFLVYVPDPNEGSGNYKLIAPDVNASADSILIGHPDGSVEFSTPIDSPLTVPVGNLTSAGKFSGTPNVASGTWRYQTLGTSQVVTNTSGSKVEVELSFRYSLQTAGSRSGVYAALTNGGADYKTTFAEGGTNLKQEGYPGGRGSFKVVLEPNQKCQFSFGAWTNAVGTMVATVGSVDEAGGTTTQTLQLPLITIRRLV